MIPEEEAQKLVRKVLGFSKADSAVVSFSGSDTLGVRFAVNSVTTAGFRKDEALSIESHFGKRSGSAQINQTDDASIEEAVRKSEQIAKLAPENPEFMEPLGPQKYLPSPSYADSTASSSPQELAALCRPVIDEANAGGVAAAGYAECGAGFSALANSKGLFACQKSTGVDFSVTVRAKAGSGWAARNENDIRRLDAAAVGRASVRKCLDSREPASLDPGEYTVILEPSATSDFLWPLLEAFNARDADEGRSFLTRKGGGNRLGEKVFGENVTIYSDPADDVVPGATFSGEGLPMAKQTWIENGVVKSLIFSRFWARKQNTEPVPEPANLILRGGDVSVDEMIKQTTRGVLVTRFWYIRTVDPQTVLLTGLTRDGNFLIENGRITKPVNNFRFNESPVAVLNNVVAMGPSVRARGGEGASSISAPAILVDNFHFSSVSKAS